MDTWHIYPQNDLRTHITDGSECQCKPETVVDDVAIYVIHKSWDGRELKEELVDKFKGNSLLN